jgi:hypothetical protein
VILEGIVTTLGADAGLNIAPMGPRFEGDGSRFVLRPFRTSTTFQNLKVRGEGVFHITDDVLLIARSAIEHVQDAETKAAEVVNGRILMSSSRYHEFRVIDLDERDDRATIRVETVATGRFRDLFGLNRAKHAVIEASILATRLGLLSTDEIRSEFARLSPLVSKTGGAAEHEAFDLLIAYVEAGGRRA